MRRKSKCRNRCEEKEAGANTGVRRRGKCLHRCEEKEVGANRWYNTDVGRKR